MRSHSLFLLLLLLLPPSASPRAGSAQNQTTEKKETQTLPQSSSEECRKPGFSLDQPAHLSAPRGGSVTIPFSFDYPWEVDKDPEVEIAWKWKSFHGEFIYNKTQNHIHKAFQNRLSLHLTKQWKNGSLQIRELRREDATTYFCRVRVKTLRCGWQVWQSITGTKLTITPARQTSTTQTPPTTIVSTKDTTSAGLGISQGSGSRPLSLEAVVGVAVACAVLLVSILGLIIYFTCKRSKGLKTKAGTPDRGSFQPPEEKDKSTGSKEQYTNPKLDSKDEGVTYATLALSRMTSPAVPHYPPPQETPEETLYSAVKTTR